VGMATEIPPHNLREVAEAARLLIRKPNASLEDILSLLPGPDFPGGGQLISQPADIREAYANGRGSLRMRARWHVEDLARGQWRVVVDELPHGVSTANVLAEIEAITNPQPRAGKKDVTQEQKNLKQLVLGILESVRDESSDKAAVRIVLEPRSSRIAQNEFMAVLLGQTSLEASVHLNLTMIGVDGRPQQKNLKQILAEWIAFRYLAVERRSRHRLLEVERRLHILEGRMTVFLQIEKVIRCIRNADEPKPELMSRFGLTETQAEDILEIRLRQLARLEGIRIEKELGELREEHGGLSTLLDSRQEMTRLIVKEIGDDARKYGDARRTLMEAVAPIVAAEIAVPDEAVTVILSQNGWVRTRLGHGIDPATIAYKTGDTPFLVAESRTIWPLLLVDDKGRAYSVRVSDIPGGRGDGVPIVTLIELQEGGRIVQAVSAAPDSTYLFANSAGYGFIAQLSDLVSRNRSGKTFLTLEKGEKVLAPARAGASTIAALSQKGRLLVFAAAEMKTMARGRGVIVMELEKGEELLAVAVNDGKAVTVTGSGRGGKPGEVRIAGGELQKHHLHRARKGCLIAGKLKPSGVR